MALCGQVMASVRRTKESHLKRSIPSSPTNPYPDSYPEQAPAPAHAVVPPVPLPQHR